MQAKLLIVGCHRSGTTLLSSMISCHKDIAIVNEDYYDSFKRILSKKYVGTKMVIPSILMRKKKSKIYVSFYRKFVFLRNFFFGSKHPVSVCNYSISDFLEDGKIIFISRNFEDNVNSIVERTSFSRKSAERDVKWSENIKNQLQNEDVLFLSLKELTNNSEEVLRSVCNYLKLDFDENMLEGFKHTPLYSNDKIEKKK